MKLERVGELYVDVEFKRGRVGPKTIEIGGKQYWRFMDFFYLPTVAADVDKRVLRQVIRLREVHYEQVVDGSLNARILKIIAAMVVGLVERRPGRMTVVDLGCGSGRSTRALDSLLPGMFVLGVDPLGEIVRLAEGGSRERVLVAEGMLPFRDECVCAVCASFVMHLNVLDEDLAETCRVLETQGVFAFNHYGDGFDQLDARIRGVGLERTLSKEVGLLNRGHYVHAYVKPRAVQVR